MKLIFSVLLLVVPTTVFGQYNPLVDSEPPSIHVESKVVQPLQAPAQKNIQVPFQKNVVQKNIQSPIQKNIQAEFRSVLPLRDRRLERRRARLEVLGR
jgi:hypothetical protein